MMKPIFRVVRIIKNNEVAILLETAIPVKINTICIHVDGVNALAFAERISKSLAESDITIAKVSEII